MRQVLPSVRLSGYALHAGVITAVTLTRHDGPLTFARDSHRAELSSLRIARTDFGVGLTDDHGFEIDLVEHFLAAVGGLGIGGGVLAALEGPELPILDGGARAFVDALLRLEIPRSPSALVVRRPGRLEWRESAYEFEVTERTEILVETEFDRATKLASPDQRATGRQSASWHGDPRRFADEIAPARTFGFVSDASALWRTGRAKLAALASQGNVAAMKTLTDAVLVFDENGLVGDKSAAKPLLPDELAKHKLLDLVGDLTLFGGPPQGRIRASRPGHTATHRMIAQAISLGILSPR